MKSSWSPLEPIAKVKYLNIFRLQHFGIRLWQLKQLKFLIDVVTQWQGGHFVDCIDITDAGSC